jgi:hypothetical protein
MSYEEYLAWAPEDMLAEWKDGEVTVAMPPKDEHQGVLNPTSEATSHQGAVPPRGVEDNMLMELFVGTHRLGVMRVAPLEVHLGPQGPSPEPTAPSDSPPSKEGGERCTRSVREPDLFFVAPPQASDHWYGPVIFRHEHMSGLGDDRFEGAPDLVVEVISGDSVTHDRRDKWGEYQAAGVREYWIVDPRTTRRQIDVYRLDEAGRYVTSEATSQEADAGGVMHSTSVATSQLPGFWLRAEWLWSEPEPLPLALLATSEATSHLGHAIEVRLQTTDE